MSVNMKTVTTREAQHHLAKVIDLVEGGEEVVLTRRGKKILRLVPYVDPDAPQKNVEWSESIRRRNENLGDIPQSQRNWVVELREEERY